MPEALAGVTLGVVAVLAFANGANDVSKGIATLAGSGRTSYRTAIAWGSVWTLAGGLASLVIAVGFVKAFTSAIISPEVLALATFPLAVSAGAAAWVVLASLTGLPVSTTHALTGAIVGVALVAGDVASVRWWILLSSIAAPLALSPLVSAAIGYGAHAFAARLSPACVCVQVEDPDEVNADGTATAARAARFVVYTCACGAAERSPSTAVAGLRRFTPAAGLHWGASAALSFARGVNDNAKIAAVGAIGITALTADIRVAFAVVALAMTVGGLFAGMRVTRTLGERVVRMDQDTGLAASLVSAALVLAASFYTLPVSTTHVATGAIVGAGVRQGSGAVHWGRVGGLVSAWIVTLPVAGALAAFAWWTLGIVQ
jgi:PiT family inorganic phosphate transporter